MRRAGDVFICAVSGSTTYCNPIISPEEGGGRQASLCPVYENGMVGVENRNARTKKLRSGLSQIEMAQSHSGDFRCFRRRSEDIVEDNRLVSCICLLQVFYF